MPLEFLKRGLKRESLGVHERHRKKDRVISNSIELSFETFRKIYQKGKNATKMNIVLKKADVLRPKKKADTVNQIENRLNDWKEKQRYLEEVGEAPLKDDQKNRF